MSTQGPKIAVGAIVINEEKLLMVRRGQSPAEGKWTVPGGKVENGEYLVDAVKREVREETGLDIKVGDLLGIFEVVGDEEHYVILDYLAKAAGEVAELTAASDATELRWVELEGIKDLDCSPRFVETLTAWGILPD